MSFYGYDEASYNRKAGRYEEPFNPNCEYFKINAYGNLVSANYIDYSDYMDQYFVDELTENWNKLDYYGYDEELEELLCIYQNIDKRKEDIKDELIKLMVVEE